VFLFLQEEYIEICFHINRVTYVGRHNWSNILQFRSYNPAPIMVRVAIQDSTKIKKGIVCECNLQIHPSAKKTLQSFDSGIKISRSNQ